jgi:NADH-quinone oxidoreductase subunit M
MQFVERASWVASLDIEYHLAVDGLGVVLLLLSALIIPFALAASSGFERSSKLYCALLLLTESALFGAFTAQNFFHWFLFWELSLVPAFFLIKFQGGAARTRAAFQFLVYTLAGSVTMLLAFVAIHAATGIFDFAQLGDLGRSGELGSTLFRKLGGGIFQSKELLEALIFLGVFLGLAVKVPLIPFHTWLPPAYAEAPTGTAMVLSGAMSKMGVYGFLRILLPIFPDQVRAFLTPLLWLAVATIVFSAAAAFAQKDLKRIVAYSSISHLGYCLLGIFGAAQLTATGAGWSNEKSAALDGVVLQMFNHGLVVAALFYFVGLLEERNGGLRGINDFGGLRQVAPVFCGLIGITIFASLGLPGLNGFVGEFLIFKGVFPLAGPAAAVSTLGLLLTAIFLLTILQRVFNGPLASARSGWTDLSITERLTLTPMIALMFLLGIFPGIVLEVVNPTVVRLVKNLSF